MSEHKGNELTSTGVHRAWVGDNVGTVVRAGSPLRETSSNWLDRGQPSNSRHAAITRSLYSLTSYKSWTDKVRHGWDKDTGSGKGKGGK